MTANDNKISLLLVEDHFVTMEGLCSWMEKTGDFRIVGQTSSAREAVELARKSHPDVTLLDLHLSDETSIEETLKQLVQTGTKVVVFSAESRKYFVDLALHSGASGFVSKADDYGSISQAIKAAATGGAAYISPVVRRSKQGSFTSAEQQLLSMLARGMKYDDIAKVRLTSPHTVRKQCDRLQLKLRLTSREELIAWSVNNGYAGT